MSFHRVLIAASLAGALMLPLTAVHAQSSAMSGTSVPGVCMLSRGAVLHNSKVGKAADARLKQLVQQADNQLKSEQKPLAQSIQQFRQKAKNMTTSERKSQQKSLSQRMQSFQTKKKKLNARVRLTRGKAMQRIGKALDPIVANVYKQHSCGILLDRNAVLAGNQSNDITADVIQALNKKMTTISFNLAPLPQKSSGK